MVSRAPFDNPTFQTCLGFFLYALLLLLVDFVTRRMRMRRERVKLRERIKCERKERIQPWKTFKSLENTLVVMIVFVSLSTLKTFSSVSNYTENFMRQEKESQTNCV